MKSHSGIVNEQCLVSLSHTLSATAMQTLGYTLDTLFVGSSHNIVPSWTIPSATALSWKMAIRIHMPQRRDWKRRKMLRVEVWKDEHAWWHIYLLSVQFKILPIASSPKTVHYQPVWNLLVPGCFVWFYALN